jgi:hypothetical protein
MTTMNLNLKKINTVMLLLLAVKIASAQKIKTSSIELYGSIGAVFNGSFNSSSSNEMANSHQTFKQYQDSTSNKETWQLNFSPQIGIIYQINRDFDLQCGLGYIVLGHQRQLNNLKFQDYTYPGVGSTSGQIVERTNVERNIKLNYRYQYLQVPLLINYHVNARSVGHKVKVSISGGVGFNILLKHDVNAVLNDGFKIDDKTSFSIDSTGFKANAISANLMLGTRLDYDYKKQIKLICQPMFGYFPLSVSSNQLEARPWYFNLSFGVIYSLDDLKK